MFHQLKIYSKSQRTKVDDTVVQDWDQDSNNIEFEHEFLFSFVTIDIVCIWGPLYLLLYY